MVPLYQRKYQWGDKQLIPFWEDVAAKAAEVLEGESKFEHYMGALILAPVDSGANSPSPPWCRWWTASNVWPRSSFFSPRCARWPTPTVTPRSLTTSSAI